jgi:hypothetical protein
MNSIKADLVSPVQSEDLLSALPVARADYVAGGQDGKHRQQQAQGASIEAREQVARVSVRQGVQGQRGLEQPQEGVSRVASRDGAREQLAAELGAAEDELSFARRAHQHYRIPDRLTAAMLRVDRARAAIAAATQEQS